MCLHIGESKERYSIVGIKPSRSRCEVCLTVSYKEVNVNPFTPADAWKYSLAGHYAMHVVIPSWGTLCASRHTGI